MRPSTVDRDACAAKAEAVWALVAAGHLKRGDENLIEYARVVGIPADYVRAERREHPVKPNASGGKRGGYTKYCSGCDRRLPVDEFPMKSATSRVRRHLCAPCYKIMQAARYESDSKRDQLATIGFKFAAIHTGRTELVCTVCGKPIVKGDRAILEGHARHARCA